MAQVHRTLGNFYLYVQVLRNLAPFAPLGCKGAEILRVVRQGQFLIYGLAHELDKYAVTGVTAKQRDTGHAGNNAGGLYAVQFFAGHSADGKRGQFFGHHVL